MKMDDTCKQLAENLAKDHIPAGKQLLHPFYSPTLLRSADALMTD